jgi:hypothetical protein
MDLGDFAKLGLLVFVGLFVLADAVLMLIRPEAMWSYASQRDYLLRALLVTVWIGFGLHLIFEWTRA